MAVKLLAPCLVHFHGALELLVGGSNFMFVRGPCGLTVAGRPVRTTQAGVREPHECTEHDDRSGERHCQPGKRSEEHTSELQSLMRISYAVFCLKKKKT